jgi:L-fucose isomerase-like protein
MEKVLIPFFSPLSEKKKNNSLLAILKKGGWNNRDPKGQIDFIASNSIQEFQIWLFIGTGGTERQVLDFLNQIPSTIIPILVSHSWDNSLPAAMEIRKYLQDSGISVRIIHANINELAASLDLESQITDVADKLHNFRLGLIGKKSEWLIASDINEKAIKDRWGIEIIYIPVSKLIQGLTADAPSTIISITEQFIQQATDVDRTKKQLHEAKKVVSTLDGIIREYELSAFTIECFSLLQETDSTACYALSYFNDIGLVAGCEGDLPSTFTMILAKLLTDQPSFMANVSSVNKKNNELMLAHCTVPLNMTENYSILSHFESKKGVAVKGRFKTGQVVTVFKIAGKSLNNWWISTGTILSNPEDDHCCRTQVLVRLDDSVEYFLEDSLANHHIMILGDHRSLIELFLKQFGPKKERN